MSTHSQTLDHHTLGKLVEEALERGLSLHHTRQLDSVQLAGLYQIAYTLYQQGKASQAQTLFRFLCLYDHLEVRHWLGLGACQQTLGEHQAAIAAYSRAALLAPDDPNLPFYAGCCYQALGQHQEALAAFRATQALAGEQPQYRTLTERAKLLHRAVDHALTEAHTTP